MDLATAQTLARELLELHGLGDWTFAFNRRKRTFGLCDFSGRCIYLSAVLTDLNGEEAVRDTLLHEIAHALAGPQAGHGLAWRTTALAVGAAPQRCYRADEVRQPPGRYLLVCPCCQTTVTRYRKPTRIYACRRCCEAHNGGRFSEQYRLQLQMGKG